MSSRANALHCDTRGAPFFTWTVRFFFEQIETSFIIVPPNRTQYCFFCRNIMKQ